jgi:hypothetical protein
MDEWKFSKPLFGVLLARERDRVDISLHNPSHERVVRHVFSLPIWSLTAPSPADFYIQSGKESKMNERKQFVNQQPTKPVDQQQFYSQSVGILFSNRGDMLCVSVPIPYWVGLGGRFFLLVFVCFVCGRFLTLHVVCATIIVFSDISNSQF